MATVQLRRLLCPKNRFLTASSCISRFAPVSSQTAANKPSVSDEESPQTVSGGVDPLKHEDFFGVKSLVTVKDLFDARVHLGHKSGCRNQLMSPYLFGQRLGVDVFDLDQTVSLLHSALNFTAHIAFREGIVLFISRNRQNLPLVERMAVECGEYSQCRRWIKGTFTNATMQFGPTVRLPNLCIMLNTLDTVFEQHPAIVECARLLIPTVGIVDSNCDPRLISYPVPANDDTPSAVQLYCDLFKQAVLLGKEKRANSRGSKESGGENPGIPGPEDIL